MSVIKFEDHPEFKPNMTPAQMFRAGIFGGAYFRPIKSGITGREHKRGYLRYRKPGKCLAGVSLDLIRGPKMDASVNKYGVLAGQSLKIWESKGWIKAQDPFGWVQWYCEFYDGRRSADDERQIARFNALAGPQGRFRKWHERLARSKKPSAKIQQTLIQWAWNPES